jgi:hypothetical protein
VVYLGSVSFLYPKMQRKRLRLVHGVGPFRRLTSEIVKERGNKICNTASLVNSQNVLSFMSKTARKDAIPCAFPVDFTKFPTCRSGQWQCGFRRGRDQPYDLLACPRLL